MNSEPSPWLDRTKLVPVSFQSSKLLFSLSGFHGGDAGGPGGGCFPERGSPLLPFPAASSGRLQHHQPPLFSLRNTDRRQVIPAGVCVCACVCVRA